MESVYLSTVNDRSHLVILGAGASLVAFPAGETTKKRLPLMNDLISVTGLDNLLDENGIEWRERNFKKIYAGLAGLKDDATDMKRNDLVAKVEMSIRDYFASMQLPSNPTFVAHPAT